MQGRAYYNLLQIQYEENPSIVVEPWEVEDYRNLKTEELFHRLFALGFVIKESEFLTYVEHCDTPEELAECLWTKEAKTAEFKKLYLVLFELWRRLAPSKQAYSLFCDELDQRIGWYDKEIPIDSELMEDVLSDLEDLLDEAVDRGEEGREAFLKISDYLAHNLEIFLVDYIRDQMKDNSTRASEWIDAFCPYFQETRWEKLLRAALFSYNHVEKASLLFRSLLDELKEELNLAVLKRLTETLVHSGSRELFLESAIFLLNHLKTEGEFQTLLAWTQDYYRCLDYEKEEKKAAYFLNTRKEIPFSTPLLEKDPIRQEFNQLLFFSLRNHEDLL